MEQSACCTSKHMQQCSRRMRVHGRAPSSHTADLVADLQLVGGAVVGQRLRVRVDGPELHALQVRLNHPVEGVAATPTHTDDLVAWGVVHA